VKFAQRRRLIACPRLAAFNVHLQERPALCLPREGYSKSKAGKLPAGDNIKQQSRGQLKAGDCAAAGKPLAPEKADAPKALSI